MDREDRQGPDDALEATQARREPVGRRRGASRASRLRWSLHHRWPRLFPDIRGRRDILAFHNAERDAAENAETALPAAQEVRVEALWVAEIFPPSRVRDLYADLMRLEWDRDPDWAGERTLSHYIREHRRSGGAGSVPINLILRRGDKRFLGSHRRADLPKGVDRAQAMVYTPYPSISILVVEFILDEAAAMRVDTSLRASYRTEVTPLGAGLSIVTPAWRKQRAVAAVRSEMRRACRDFMRRNFHGRFASTGGEAAHPALELITTSKGLVVGNDSAAAWSLSTLLGVSRRFGSWTTRRGPTMHLTTEDDWAGADTNTVVINMNRVRMTAEAKRRGYGMPTSPDVMARAGQELAAVWAIRLLLDGYLAELAEARDRLLIPSSRSPASDAIRKLRAIDNTVLTLSGDIRVTTADVLQLTRPGGGILTRDSPQFFPMEKSYGTRPFADALLEEATRQAGNLRAREGELRELLNVDASTKGAIASISLQRWVIRWTVLITVLTTLLVWLAIETLNAATAHH
jgi:type II secretory pathway pseudopilin PulG